MVAFRNFVYAYSVFTCFTAASTSVPLDIGLQHTFFSTTEGQGSVELCTVVISGNISGSSIEIEYTTVDGLARGAMLSYIIVWHVYKDIIYQL